MATNNNFSLRCWLADQFAELYLGEIELACDQIGVLCDDVARLFPVEDQQTLQALLDVLTINSIDRRYVAIELHEGGDGHTQDSHGRWADDNYDGPPDLNPRAGVRITAQGYYGGIQPFEDKGYSKTELRPEWESKRKTPVDTDYIVAMREHNASMPSTFSIPDDAPVWYGGKVMTRAEMRNAIAEDLVSGKHEGRNFEGFDKQKVIDIYMGPPAAGKSSIVERIGGKRLVVDSDRIKELIPEYDRGRNANGVHEESSAINDLVLHKALNKGIAIAMPIVGSNPHNVVSIAKAAKNKGYKVNLHLVDASTDITIKRTVDRLHKTGRFVDPVYITTKVQNNPKNTFKALHNDKSLFDSARAWSTNPRTESPSGFPPVEISARSLAEMESGHSTLGMGRRTFGSIGDAHRALRTTRLHYNVLVIENDDWCAQIRLGTSCDDVVGDALAVAENTRAIMAAKIADAVGIDVPNRLFLQLSEFETALNTVKQASGLALDSKCAILWDAIVKLEPLATAFDLWEEPQAAKQYKCAVAQLRKQLAETKIQRAAELLEFFKSMSVDWLLHNYSYDQVVDMVRFVASLNMPVTDQQWISHYEQIHAV